MHTRRRSATRESIVTTLAAAILFVTIAFIPERIWARPAAAAVTGTLMWSQYTTWPDNFTWEGALAAAAAHTEGAFDDWRLPTIDELQAAALDGSIGAFNEFNGTSSELLWTSREQGRWAWVVRVHWENGVPVSSESGEAIKVLKGSSLKLKFVRDAGAAYVCGNGVLDPGETPCNCPEDAGAADPSETSCSDGIDNDCDGLIDANDPDCDGGAIVVDRISPSSMVRGTSTNVTITGIGFSAGAVVTFENGSSATPVASNVLVIDDTTITAGVAVASGGPPKARVWDVRVVNSDSTTGVLVAGFTVLP